MSSRSKDRDVEPSGDQLRERKLELMDNIFRGDKGLWIIISCLVLLSLMVVYSSTASMAYRNLDGDTTHYLIDQFRNLLIGVVAMFVVHRIDYKYFGRLAELLFYLSLVAVVAAYFIGSEINGASRWLHIGGFSFQPSDALRVSLVLLLAKRLDERNDTIDDAYLLPKWNTVPKDPSNDKILHSTTIPILGPILVSSAVVVFANLSTAIMLFVIGCLVLYIGRVRVRELMKLFACCALFGTLAISTMYIGGVGRAETWVNRITSFVGVEDEDVDTFQQEQARITVASGGILGKGPGQSTQRSNLPHSYSDFAFAFIIEEYGDIVAGIVLLFYLWLFARSKLIFKQSGRTFPSILVLGLSMMITMQALLNMLVSVGIGPITGQTLPMISKGGSSVLFTGIAFGMILSVSRQLEETKEEVKVEAETEQVRIGAEMVQKIESDGK